MASRRRSARRITATLLTMTLTAFGLVAAGLATGVAVADTSPPVGVPATVSADPLPTVQIDGVAWDQVVVGNTVYVTGSFAFARPAGTTTGSSQRVARANLLAYNITNGNLITTFNHTLNAQGRQITASPDGTRLYVTGNFTQVDGTAHSRIAAFDLTNNGALITTFTASLNNTGLALAASDTTVYVGGSFSTASGSTRSRLAAFTRAGALTTWSPGADAAVTAMTLASDNSRVIVGGQFVTLAGAARIGVGSVLTAGTGAPGTWPADFPIKQSGASANLTSLSTSGDTVYGTSYYFTQGGNFEGRFAVDPYTGTIVWMNTCHGDTYDIAAIGAVTYSAGHIHDCSDVSSFTQDIDSPIQASKQYLTADSVAPTCTLRKPIFTGGAGIPGPRYFDFSGQPCSTPLDWWPLLQAGSYTGQGQAAWTIEGNANYLAVGGEFLSTNGTAQQGLVRYAVRALAPNNIGPQNVTAPSAVSLSAGTLRVSWRGASDQDNSLLTYALLRDGGTTPIYTTTYAGAFWKRPMLGFTDSITGSHTYRVRVSDPLGNTVTSAASASATAGSATIPSYAAMVRADGASNLWRFSESSGTTAFDYGRSVTTSGATTQASGYTDLTLKAGVVFAGVPGPIAGQGTAATFSGNFTVVPPPPPPPGFPPRPPTITSDNVVYATGHAIPMSTYSLEAWVQTTSVDGGVLLSDSVYNSTLTSLRSPSVDRVLYLTGSGTVQFGMFSNNSNQTIGSPGSYNDGAWHHIVATIGAGGATLYVDGAQVASNPALSDSAVFSGFWRLGGDALTGFTPQPVREWLAANVADVAIYPSVLAANRITAHFQAGGGVVNVPPVAAFTSTCTQLSCVFDASGSVDPDGGAIASYSWAFGDTGTDTGVSPTHLYGGSGTYSVTLTVTDAGGAVGAISLPVTVSGPPPVNNPPTAAFTSSCTDLTCSFNGTSSTDGDGTVVNWAWNFGDGAVGSGSTTTHPYSAAGTYTVTLVVTDDDTATDDANGSVSPTDPPTNAPFANDTFTRTVNGGLGTADLGGAWTTSPAANFSANGTTGRVNMSAAGMTGTAFLGGTSSTSTDLTATFSLDKVPTATAFFDFSGRRTGTNTEYTGVVKITSSGAVQVNIRRYVNSTSATELATTVVLPGVTYTAGTQLNVRFQAEGTGSTALRFKVWPTSVAEPAAWTVTATDTTAALQVAGSVGLRTYLGGSATNAPIIETVDNFVARPVV